VVGCDRDRRGGAGELRETARGLPFRLPHLLAEGQRLTGAVGDTVALQLLDGRDQTVERTLTLAEQPGQKQQIGYLPPLHIWIDVKRLDESIGYVAFNMFLDPVNVMPTFNAAMQTFMDADGLIIDIRGNGGGLPGMAMGMAGWLIAAYLVGGRPAPWHAWPVGLISLLVVLSGHGFEDAGLPGWVPVAVMGALCFLFGTLWFAERGWDMQR